MVKITDINSLDNFLSDKYFPADRKDVFNLSITEGFDIMEEDSVELEKEYYKIVNSEMSYISGGKRILSELKDALKSNPKAESLVWKFYESNKDKAIFGGWKVDKVISKDESAETSKPAKKTTPKQ